ncbi:MAG: glycosyltransferase family 39 protein [Desulfobacteraceae bacterium]|nr:glycosyltransferase family 39 protein [Desulfobacteraceae bacterium]MBC2757887.1 glycosyltransferase family 39 protein [Desulfobacteraceae bacterium]
MNSILSFPEIYWTTKTWLVYGTSIQYILGTMLFPLKLFFLKSLNLDFEYYIFVSIFSRFASIILGTGCIYLTYLIAKKSYDEKVALLSAAFLSVAFYHTLNSALITLDVSSSFLLMLNFFLCFRAMETNRLLDYILLGIASGLLVGTKIVLGIFFCIPFILNYLKFFYPLSNTDTGQFSLLNQTKLLIFYLLIAIIVFIAFHPHIFLDFDKYISFYLSDKHNFMDRTRTSINGILFIWGKNTIKSMGPFLPVFAFFGVFLKGKKSSRNRLMLLLFLGLYYGFFRWFLDPRYIIAISPIICIFAAGFCIWFLNQKKLFLRYIGIATIIIAMSYSLYWCISGISLRLNDTRLSAAKFIMQHIPKGTTIGISGVSEKYDWRTHSWDYPKIDFRRYRGVNFLNEPELLILNSNDFEKVINTLNSGKLRKNYVLPETHYKDWYKYSAPSPRIFRFYDDLLVKNKSSYVLLKTFQQKVNVPLEFAPPEIRIYQKML